MPSYALLLQPSANRVYTASSVELTRAELAVLGDGRWGDATPTEIAGVRYLCFDAELSPTDLDVIANVSTAFALFEYDGRALMPVCLVRRDIFDDDLVTILKYQGKTNEIFTKLLLNVTVASSSMGERTPRILDPMCGRGTTLNQALMYGWSVAGVDVDQQDFDVYSAFLRTWLKTKRLKHTAESAKLRREGAVLGRRFEVRVGVSKEDWKAGRAIDLDLVNADTLDVRSIYRPACFDAIVTDAPYGVQHGSHAGQRLARSPLALLEQALPGWVEVLRPGGAIGVAWNTHVASREDALDLLKNAGLDPLNHGPYLAFGHRVDQAIHRDILIARRPAG